MDESVIHGLRNLIHGWKCHSRMSSMDGEPSSTDEDDRHGQSLSCFCHHRQNQLSYQAGGFYALKSRISFETYSEPLKQTRQFCEGLVEWISNHI